jgi:hypothetical protein
MSAEVSRARGRPARAARRLSSCVASVFMTPWLRPKAAPDDGSFAPTRSARTPLVTKPRPLRVETPKLHGRPSRRAGADRPRRSRLACPAFSRPARKRGARVAPRTTCSREAGSADRAHRGDPLAQTARAPPAQANDAPLARTPPPGDRGPLHPSFREEDRDPPHPRCLPSMSRPGFRPRALARDRPVDRALSTSCHQPVENTRRA